MNTTHLDDFDAQLRELDWYQFEKLIALIYLKLGHDVTRHGGANPDAGIDLILERDGQLIAVQCKHWQRRKVGVKNVRELLGALTAEQLPMGILVAMSGYTTSAKRFATKHGIELVDKAGLMSLSESASLQTDAEFLRFLHDKGKVCPKCESVMVLRTTKKEKGAGRKFWGCSAYPSCQYTLPSH